jgi:hypothetical protein
VKILLCQEEVAKTDVSGPSSGLPSTSMFSPELTTPCHANVSFLCNYGFTRHYDYETFCIILNLPNLKLTKILNQFTVSDMTQKFDNMKYNVSYQPDWSSTWKSGSPCQCAPASYGGNIPYFDSNYYPREFTDQNRANAARCQQSIYANPKIYSLDTSNAPCLNTQING